MKNKNLFKKDYGRDIKRQLFIFFVLHIAYIYADIIINPYDYVIHKGSSCPPTFSLPILDMYNALFASTLVIFILKVLKIKYTVLELIVIFNMQLLVTGAYSLLYLYGRGWFYFTILSKYVGNVTFLYAINLFTLGFLFFEDFNLNSYSQNKAFILKLKN